MNNVDTQHSKRCKLIVTGAYPDSVADFRGDLIRAFVTAECQVTVMTAEATPNVKQKIQGLGVDFRPYWINRNAVNVSSDRKTLAELRTAYSELRPDLILAYTIKPIVWGGIAARHAHDSKFFALVTGLGYAFQGGSLKRRLLKTLVVYLYWFALKRAKAVIFQNNDNRDLFIKHRIVPAAKCHVVSGSGVNMSEYPLTPLPAGLAHFLLIARLLGEKGIREFCQAAKQVKSTYPEAKFSIIGPEDPSPDGIPMKEIESWHKSGTICYHGATSDVRPFLNDCHIYTLPSYHEGMPRTVLEAMAMGRPILTTDVVGCRETVEQGVNGFLVPNADSDALAERMIWFIENRDQWQAMGDASRKIVEDKFDVHKVNAEMLRIMGIQS
ncbi:MAG: glycosyltransferase family 4 protein [Pirellulaceae bacterium]|nr:glycosyltransferase family 4 protein [Pirellulaceae bacterium]